MAIEVQVGDRVRLVGTGWEGDYDGYGVGDVVEVVEIDEYGGIWVGEVGAVGVNGRLYSAVADAPDYAVEIVPDRFADGVLSFAPLDTPLSRRELENIRAAGEALGIEVGYKGQRVEDLLRGALTFEQKVRTVLDDMATLLVEKNAAYGNSALDPVRIFSKADATEQLYVRLDDKVNRVKQGHEYPGDDTIRDIIGYCTLILIAREDNA